MANGVGKSLLRRMMVGFVAMMALYMRLISLLNHYQHFPGFVYERARHCASNQTIEIAVRPRRGSRPVCSGCDKPAPAYDHLKPRRFEFVPLWGCMPSARWRIPARYKAPRHTP